MKKYLLFIVIVLATSDAIAQSCNEIMEFVKSKSYGTTYTSFTSDAISKVTFYNVNVDYKTLHFAIVCFKNQYSYSCKEYIYQVASNTQFNYSLDHYSSAGKAFWKHIEPHNRNLGCAPNFD